MTTTARRLCRADLQRDSEIGRAHPGKLLANSESFLEKLLAKRIPEKVLKFARVCPERTRWSMRR